MQKQWVYWRQLSLWSCMYPANDVTQINLGASWWLPRHSLLGGPQTGKEGVQISARGQSSILPRFVRSFFFPLSLPFVRLSRTLTKTPENNDADLLQILHKPAAFSFAVCLGKGPALLTVKRLWKTVPQAYCGRLNQLIWSLFIISTADLSSQRSCFYLLLFVLV